AGDGGLTLTSRKRDVPTNNADRKGNADRELNIDYLLDFNDAISIDGPNSPPTLPERGPQTFTEGYNKLWEAGNIVKDNLTKENDSITFQYYDHRTVRDGHNSFHGETTIREVKTTKEDTVGKNYHVVP